MIIGNGVTSNFKEDRIKVVFLDHIFNDGNLGTSMLGGQITSRFLPKLLKCEVNSLKHVRRIRRGLGNKGYVRCDAYYMIFFNA